MSSPKVPPRLQDLARQSLKRQLSAELKSGVSPKRKSEIRKLTNMMADMKVANRTTRTEEAKLRERSLARKVVNRMRISRNFTGTIIREHFPTITEYKIGTTKFRLTSNNMHYTHYLKPTLLESMVKRDNKITMKLDCQKIRDCSLSRHIIIDILTGQVKYYIIRSNERYNVEEVARDNDMKFELIR